LQADVTKTGYKGYVAPEFIAAGKSGTAQPGTSGGAPWPPAGADKCEPTEFEVVTQPTGATDAAYENIPATGGSGTGLTLQVTVDKGAVDAQNYALNIGAVADKAAVTKYRAGDVVTIAAGLLGAGSSGMTIKLKAVTCTDTSGNQVPAPPAPKR
jgi:hypothetical protein